MTFGPPAPARGARTRLPAGCLAVAVIAGVGPILLIIAFVALNAWEIRRHPVRPVARMVAVATAVPDGSDVEVTIEPATATPLPATVTLGLPVIDDGYMTRTPSTTTGATMRYSGRRSGAQAATSAPVAGGDPMKVTVPGDRHRLVFLYHVDTVAGRRVVFLPAVFELDVSDVTYTVPAGGIDCEWTQRTVMQRPYYQPCMPGAGRILTRGYSRSPLRLELTGA